MRNIKAILFDVDGTLLDTTEFILQAFEHALRTHSLSVPDRSRWSEHIGKSIEDLYTHFTQVSDPTPLIDTHRVFQKNNLHLSTPFPNTKDTLHRLFKKGFTLAAVTSRSKDSSIITLENAGIAHYFDIVISAEDVTNFKPHPEPLMKALTHIGTVPEHAVMIGDTEVDIMAGKNAGTRTVGVTYGFQGALVKNFSPDHTVDDIAEILTLF